MIRHRISTNGKFSLLLLPIILLVATSAAAQFPDKFTNLRVLPKDISRAQLEGTMRRFAFALNVRCVHCHVQKANNEMDFAADEKETKKTARVMLQMVAAINRDYVAKLGKPAPIQVECVTCHHGLAQPRPLNAVLAEALEKDGLDGATKLYHDLRNQYYGTGQYDFGETSLNQLTESLLARKMVKEAVAIMEMNFASNNPTSLWSYHMLAQVHESNGEVEKAKADYRKVLELHPEDSWARQQLDSLSTPK